MSNDVQSHESVVERLPGEERRASPRHAASTLGEVTARIIGGSPVDLVNFSARGVLFECDSRLLIGARASVRITTADANLIVSGRVVRSRVKGLVNGALRYDAALALDHELTLRPVPLASDAAPAAVAGAVAGAPDEADEDVSFESELDGSFDPAPVEAYLAESQASLDEVAHQDQDTAEEEAIALFDGAPASEDAVVEPPALPAPANLHVEVAVRATLEEAEPAVAPEAAMDAAVEAAPDEPIAFEADGVTFEGADEFVFEEAAEPVFEEAAVAAFEPMPADAVEPEPAAATHAEAAFSAAGPEGESMFDATPYAPPAEEAPPASSMFEATPPNAVLETNASSMFDARPSETWRAAETGEPVDEAPVPAADDAPVLATAAEGIDFETDVAFEADDAVMFEAAFEAGAAPAPEAAAIAAVDAAVEAEPVADVELAADADPVTPAGPAAEVEPLDAAPEPAVEHAAAQQPPDPAPDDDRALMPFIATVPVDLADLRRIAADNQW